MKGLGYVIGWLLASFFHLLKKILILIIKIFNLQDKPVFQRIFGESIGTNRVKITVHKTSTQDTIPESFEKGEKFEDYIRKEIFKKNKYIIVERSHNYKTNKGDYVESTLKPDFKFRNKSTQKEFYLEAKYRTKLHNGRLKWSNLKQIKRYKEYSTELPFYTVIGLGGSPGNPENLYMIEVNNQTRVSIKNNDLDSFKLLSQISKYNLN
jgi:hypothetical protein